MAGVDGVFSVQPSSPGGTVTDEQEVRYGITIADLAVECGVKHLVYSSGSAAGETPTGVAHYDTKAEIERHIRRLPLAATIVRPATFMELLVMPGFGLDEGHFHFYAAGGGCRCWRWRISAILSRRFCRAGAVCRQDVRDRQRQRDRSPAGGVILRGGGTADPYSRFSDEVLAASPFLHKLTGLVDDGRLAGMPTSTPCASCIRSCTPSPAGWRAPAVPPSSGR
jgi:hypothetical protein